MADKTTMFLVRHGQTEWNQQNRLQGHKNSSLTKNGRMQAFKVRESLSTHVIHAAYTSPLQRAKTTMEIILEGRDITAIESSNLKEISLGPWEGKTKEETKISHPNKYEQFWGKQDEFSLSGAETYHQLQKRFVAELNAIFKAEKNKTILIVSHWIAIKVALAYFSLIPLGQLSRLPDPGNGTFITLIKQGNKITIDDV